MPLHDFVSGARWKTRALMWTSAAAVGGAAVAFAKLADVAQLGFRRMLGVSALAPWLLAPLGFCAIAWLTRRYFPGAEGSGIPQTIYAQRPESGVTGASFLAPRVVVGRVALAAVGLLCGGSIGREGPTVHVGAVIVHGVWRWLPGRSEGQRRAMILAGGAAGVAAAFNTPLAGIVFAIEELSRSFEERASGTTLTAVILAGVVAIALLGDYNYFGQPVVAEQAYRITPYVLFAAAVCGVAGGLFSRLTLASSAHLPPVVERLRRRRPALFAGVCGLGIAAIGAASGGLTYGTGYDEARSILENHAHLSWLYAPARALATLLSYLSGIPAGLLAPSLSVGAGLGQTLADLTRQTSAVPFAILGMCGFLAGVTQAPLTSFVIVMEMTSQHAMVLPLMVSGAIATTVSKLISPPLYSRSRTVMQEQPESTLAAATALDELPAPAKENLDLVASFHDREHASISGIQLLIERISAFFGSPWYFAFCTCFIAAWMAFNTWGRRAGWPVIDPPPFNILQGLVSSNALLLTVAVLIRQNRMARLAEHRSHLDLQINLLTEQKATKILQMVDELHRELTELRRRPEDEVLDDMTKPADANALLHAIKQQTSSY